MKFVFTKTFQKSIKKFSHRANQMKLIIDWIDDFQVHLFDSRYYRKKLKWYTDIHELQIWWDIRIIVQILIQDDVTYFLNIGTHSSLGISGNKKKKKR